jgi:hypothetical protein
MVVTNGNEQRLLGGSGEASCVTVFPDAQHSVTASLELVGNGADFGLPSSLSEMAL